MVYAAPTMLTDARRSSVNPDLANNDDCIFNVLASISNQQPESTLEYEAAVSPRETLLWHSHGARCTVYKLISCF